MGILKRHKKRKSKYNSHFSVREIFYNAQYKEKQLTQAEIREELTDEWKQRGVQEGQQFATMTDINTKT